MSILSHLTSLFHSEEGTVGEASLRLEKVVSRHRDSRCAELQGKLSPQATDPPPEEVTQPLYDVSVYTGPG
jgi:hypothetical protein